MNIQKFIIIMVMVMVSPCSVFAAERAVTKPIQQKPQQSPTVLSIIPAQAEPGTKIIMSGSHFGSNPKAFLGNTEIAANTLDEKNIEFTIPGNLQAGVYALYLQRKDGVTSRPYNFTVLSIRPVLSSLSPESIPSCNIGKDREIIARGKNFIESSQLFFDGMVLPSTFQSQDAISFTPPQVSGGLHQVSIKNSPDNSSVTVGLMIETRPEISHVAIGSEFVNFYELIIEGRNFQQSTTILVDGIKIGSKGDDLAAREKVIYMGCTKLIYQRHPYSPATKEFRLQVVNPGGDGSQVVTVSAP